MISSSDSSVRQHIKNYYSKLISGIEFPITNLIDTYRQMSPAIHHHLADDNIDTDILSYCLNRLPPQIFYIKKIILAQNKQIFIDNGYDLDTWVEVKSNSRRRKSYCSSGLSALAEILTSDADIDDLINILIAVDIEFEKIKTKLINQKDIEIPIHQKLGLSISDWKRLSILLGSNYLSILDILKSRTSFFIELIAFKADNYQLSASKWWTEVLHKSLIFGLEDIPVYIISSNLHSLTNIASGYVNAHQTQIYEYLQFKYPEMYKDYLKIINDPSIIRKEDFFYFVSNLFFKTNRSEVLKKTDWENKIGIKNLNLNSEIDCDVQIIPVSTLAKAEFIDPALKITDTSALSNSQAIILNIDYPLGFTAYLIMNEILKTQNHIKGIYIVGKAAILQGQVGDVQIPNVVFDERLNNVISFDNIFNTHFPSTSKNFSVLNNQKAISVQGVILENKTQIDNYLKTNFNIIEMESGSYLTAIAQKYNFANEFPKNQVCKLSNLPFDLGIINYASDNPLGANLGQGTMNMKGVEPTYASLLAIVQRIIDLEESK